jgi:hypothetical protein
MRPATTREIAVILGRLAIHFPPPDRPPEHHEIAFEDYAEDLGEYPAAVLGEVTRNWRRTEKWWPKVCELREKCDALLFRYRKQLTRLRFLQWCLKEFDGQCPRLYRRAYQRLESRYEGVDLWTLEEVMGGKTVFHDDLVMLLPGVTKAELEEKLGLHRHDRTDPVIAAHRAEVSAILGAAGYSTSQQLPLRDMTIDRARVLAAERMAEETRKKARGQVLQVLLNGGITIPEIEADALLDLTEQQARQLVAKRQSEAPTGECHTGVTECHTGVTDGDDSARLRSNTSSPPASLAAPEQGALAMRAAERRYDR